MQDIIPPYKLSRGQIRPPARVAKTRPISRPVERAFYAHRTRVVDGFLQTAEIMEMETTATFTHEPAPMTKGVEHLSPEAKTLVLESVLQSVQRELRKEKRQHRDLKRFGLVFVASVFVLVTGYVSIDTWMVNSRVKAETVQGASIDPSDNVAEVHKAREGKDETKPTPQTVAQYSVGPSMPKTLHIDKLNINARIMPMSVNIDSSIQAPLNIFDAGWYNGSAMPGEIGAAFIDGHASGPTHQGLFAYLETLKKGDKIQIEKGSGDRLTYKVVHTQVAKLKDLNMKKMLLPYGNALRGLNLMTCTGEWIPDQQTYDHRVLVWAEQV